MKYRVGDTVVIKHDVYPGMHYTFRYSTGYKYSYMITGSETWATPGAVITIEAVLCVGAHGALMYRANGCDNLMSEMIDHTATAKRMGNKLVKGEYVVVTRSDNFCTNNFSNGYVYRVRENHKYLRVEKDNSGVPNGAPYIQIEDIRPASKEEIVVYKMNGGPCPAIGTAIDSIGTAIDLRHRYTPITGYTIKDTGVRIRYNKKIHQKAQVFKKRAKTKRKLIIK